MRKKSTSRTEAKQELFRESDFAGRPPQEQAKLSGSFNLLSEQIASTRLVLKQMEGNASGPSPTSAGADAWQGGATLQNESSDDDTAVPS